jgi:site-specific DNA-methyltransferase (adenine-specific)
VKNVSKDKTEHPCQIPELLIERIILTTAEPHQLIVDVFAGSGSTSRVAQKLGFDSISYEIDPHYCEIIRQRVNCNQLIY